LSGVKQCFPDCRDFKCTKRSLSIRGREAWCEWTDDECTPKGCNYATCCGKTIKRRTREDDDPDDLFPDEIQMRGKLMRKTGERSIF